MDVATQTAQPGREKAWARVYPALKRSLSKSLRRGVWYPVVRDDLPDRITIRMGARPVDVPRSLLEVRRERPGYFSVVTRTEQQPGTDRIYLVCPACSHRIQVFGQPQFKDCPECRHRGEVGWWEA